jgi:hypothetical protein
MQQINASSRYFVYVLCEVERAMGIEPIRFVKDQSTIKVNQSVA